MSATIIETFKLDKGTTLEDVKACVDKIDDPKTFTQFLLEINDEIVSVFGSKTVNYLNVYKPTNEILIEIHSQKRPDVFLEKLNEFEFPHFYHYPVDLCRHNKYNKKIKHVGGE